MRAAVHCAGIQALISTARLDGRACFDQPKKKLPQENGMNTTNRTTTQTQETQADVVRMTMDEWKRTHRDFKTCNLRGEKGRWVMRMGPKGSALYPVEIVK